jgi:hypothetical protein
MKLNLTLKIYNMNLFFVAFSVKTVEVFDSYYIA